jgi:hypothetical protein
MLARFLNIFFLQILFLQSFSFGSSPQKVPLSELEDASRAIKKLNQVQLKEVYLSILPLIHHDDAKTIDLNFFESTMKSLNVTEKGIYLKSGVEEAHVTDIDMKNLSASFNGKKLDLTKSVAENLSELFPEKKSSFFLQLLIPTAFAQSSPAEKAPGKIKLMALLVAGAIVAVITAGAIAFGWLKINKTSKQETIQEIKAPGVEEIFREDCNATKQELIKPGLGERASAIVQRVHSKMHMLSQTQAEAQKMKQDRPVQWIQEIKDCYSEVLEAAEKSHKGIKSDSSRSIKEVSRPAVKGASSQKATKQ